MLTVLDLESSMLEGKARFLQWQADFERRFNQPILELQIELAARGDPANPKLAALKKALTGEEDEYGEQSESMVDAILAKSGTPGASAFPEGDNELPPSPGAAGY